ncbi:MAG: HAD family hydrolase [Anaerolineae bacterium]|jgi:beta-phosphoglucomutase|nr:HAD family phosphatase [Chloroflexota bacterium]
MTIGLIWDMDGVLIDSGRAHYLAWKALFDELKQPLTAEQVAQTLGMANLPILRMWLGEDRPTADLLALADRKEALFRSLVAEQVQILPGVLDWLARARERGYRQAVASSAPMANITAIIHGLGLGDAFDILISGARLPASKPDPAVFVQAGQGLGCAPSSCVVLEDSAVGVEAAVRAGMPCVAVTNTLPAAQLQAASIVVDSLEELPLDIFQRLTGA